MCSDVDCLHVAAGGVWCTRCVWWRMAWSYWHDQLWLSNRHNEKSWGLCSFMINCLSIVDATVPFKIVATASSDISWIRFLFTSLTTCILLNLIIFILFLVNWDNECTRIWIWSDLLLGRAEWADLCFTYDVFYSPWDLRAPSTNRRETLSHDQYLDVFCNPTPKISGLPPNKNLRPKTCKIWGDFAQLLTFIVNISGNTPDIQNWKDMWSTAIPPALWWKKSGELWSTN